MPDNIDEFITEKNRRSIGLLSAVDLEGWLREKDPSERKHYVSQVAALYELLETELKTAVMLQVDYLARYAASMEEIHICRGGINFGETLINHFKEMRAEHLENIKPKEEFDPNKIMPE